MQVGQIRWMDDVFHPQKGGLSSLKQTARASPWKFGDEPDWKNPSVLVAFAVSFREGTPQLFQ